MMLYTRFPRVTKLFSYPYQANAPVDPSLWDGRFSVISLFGYKDSLKSDANRMTTFITQRHIEDISQIFQLHEFGFAARSFISAISECYDLIHNSVHMIT